METQVLEDILASLVHYHKAFAWLFIIPFALNLWILVFSSHNLGRMLRQMWFVTPIIFLLLGIAVLSGINAWLFGGVGLKFNVVAMIAFCVFVFFGEIFRFKLLKVARRTNMDAMMGYVRFSKILYTMDLVLFLLLLAVV